ncbi:DUF1206 domain-containing protein [soil metagenome]
MANPVKRAARATRANRPVRFLARLGFAVNALLHVLIGVVAVSVALGAGGQADQSGALAALAATPGGAIILWVVFVGLLALGLWLIVNAFLSVPREAKKRAVHYVSEIGKGVAYLAVAITTLTFALGGSSDSAQAATSVSASFLASPGGAFLLVLVGAGVVAIGVYFVVKGVTRRFTRDLTLPTGQARRATIALGVFGYLAKGVVLVVVGILFWVAVATFDASKGSGLDGGLKALASLPLGVFILVAVGLGLIAYGLYTAVRARYARL